MKFKVKLKIIVIPLYLILATIFIVCLKFGYIVSGSMIPTIKIGQSVIYTSLIDSQHIKVGDIVIYHNSSSNKNVIHRVIDVKYDYINDKLERQYKVQGDNNSYADAEYVTSRNYIGKVIHIIKLPILNKLIGCAQQSKIARILTSLIAPIIAIFIFLLLVILFKEEDEHINKNESEEEK